MSIKLPPDKDENGFDKHTNIILNYLKILS